MPLAYGEKPYCAEAAAAGFAAAAAASSTAPPAPTPHYNNAVLEDCSFVASLRALHAAPGVGVGGLFRKVARISTRRRIL